jgi:hypothetical protein
MQIKGKPENLNEFIGEISNVLEKKLEVDYGK